MARIALIDAGSRQNDWLDFTISACQAASRYDTDLIILMAGFEPTSSGRHGMDLVEIYNVVGKLADAPIAIVRGSRKQNVAYELLRKSPHGYQILDDYVWMLENWKPVDFQGTKLLAIGTSAEAPHYGGKYEGAQLARDCPEGGHRAGPVDVLITHAPPSQVIRDNAGSQLDHEAIQLEIGVSSAELTLSPKFHFYSDIHLGVAETRAKSNAVPVDPRGELVIFDTKTSTLFRLGVKVMSWKLKRPRRWPGGLLSMEQLGS